MSKAFKSTSWVLILTLLLLGVPMLAGAIASAFDYEAFDPDGAFAWLYVHHLVQAFVFILLIVAIRRFRNLDFGLGMGDVTVGVKCVLRFALLFSLYLVVTLVPAVLMGLLPVFAYPLTPRNVLGYLSFQLLMSGPSEELIFRAFAITMLGTVVKGRFLSGKVSLANFLAALIFGLAHVSFSLAPFSVSFSIPQVVLSVVLGLFYGDCYEKSGSVLYPMIMHSFGNVATVGLTLIATVLIR